MKKIFTFMAAALMAATAFAAKETVLDVNYAELAVANVTYNSKIDIVRNTNDKNKVNGTDMYPFSFGTVLAENAVMTSRGDGMLRYSDVRNLGMFNNNKNFYGIKALQAGDVVEIAYNGGANSDGTMKAVPAMTDLFNVTVEEETNTYTLQFTYGNKSRTLDYTVYTMTVDQDGPIAFALQTAYIAYIKIIRGEDDPVVTISTAQYATYYNADHAFVMPEGLEGITVNGVEGSTLTLNTSYNAGDVVPAGEALILHATSTLETATNFVLYTGTATSEPIAENMLKGTSTEDEETTGGAPYYRLSKHEGVVGFYWGADNGAAFQPGANKAYLALNTTNAPIRFIIEGTEVATDIENIAEQTAAQKVMINGQVFILRGEKLFDTVGRQVK